MKDTIKKALKLGLAILPIALVGGLFTGMYTYEHYDEATRKLLLSQIGSYHMFLVITTIQSSIYGFLAAVLWKVFVRKDAEGRKQVPEGVLIAANLIAALVFAAGHLPTTMAFFGGLTPVIVFRCFLLNGCFALVFGRYYRKYGIQYAILGHFGIHLVSKLILLAVL